jgi:hypothetical protein
MADKNTIQNPVLQAVHLSFLEIVGRDQAGELFREQNIEPDYLPAVKVPTEAGVVIERIGDSLYRDFGQLAAQGLLIRAGRASLVFIRRFFPQVAELGSLQNRLKPVDRRFYHSLENLADLWSRETGLPSAVRQADRGEFVWSMAEKTSNQGEARSFVPYFIFGLLEEFCTWLDARKSYRVVYSQPANGGLAELSISIHPQE